MTKSGSGEGGSSRDGPGGDKRPPSKKKTAATPSRPRATTAATPPRPRALPPPPPPATQTPAERWSLMSGHGNQRPPLRTLPFLSLPPPPPPAAATAGAGGGILVGGGASGSSVSADISNTRPHKRKASVVVAPDGFPPVCTICKRRFDTPKALFGHLRSHPERPWRGAYPPPGFEDDGGRARLDIDLNERPMPPQSRESMEEGEEIDLNKPPPKTDDDEGASN